MTPRIAYQQDDSFWPSLLAHLDQAEAQTADTTAPQTTLAELLDELAWTGGDGE